MWPPARGKQNRDRRALPAVRATAGSALAGSAFPSPPMLYSFFHLFCNYCFFGDRALEQRPGCPTRSPHTTTGRTGSAGCPGAATLPSAPSPACPSSRSGQPQPRSAAAVPTGCPQDPCFPKAPTTPPWSLQRCRWGRTSARGSGHARSPSNGGGRPGTDRNMAPTSAASFAGAALPMSAKTSLTRCPLCLKCHQLRKLPSGSRGHHPARQQLCGQERAGRGRGLPGKGTPLSALARPRGDAFRSREQPPPRALRVAPHPGRAAGISITHLPTLLTYGHGTPRATAPTPQTSQPLRPTNHALLGAGPCAPTHS